mmetsp:Transcript_25844/g.65161  ORF Transcript_25844/g.65161 Transcript_25844/m.65161 type:complete len:345 (-) Transcript_25844:216-1250(-)
MASASSGSWGTSSSGSSSSTGTSVFWTFLPGAAHATTSILVGYPFDTVKTRLQTGTLPVRSSSFFNALSRSFRNEGFFYLYRGCGVPLTSLLLKRPIEFAVYESLNESRPGSYFTNGASAALVGCALGCPFNIVKIRVQNSASTTVREALRAVYREAPFGAGFFRGLSLQVGFGVPSASMYLGLYGKFREALLVENDGLVLSKGSAGGLAGVASSMIMWSVLMPIDTLRTKVQSATSSGGTATSTSASAAPGAGAATASSASAASESVSGTGASLPVNNKVKVLATEMKPKSASLSISEAARLIYAERGARGFWSGLLPMYLRALAITAPAMFAYETTRAWVNG